METVQGYDTWAHQWPARARKCRAESPDGQRPTRRLRTKRFATECEGDRMACGGACWNNLRVVGVRSRAHDSRLCWVSTVLGLDEVKPLCGVKAEVVLKQIRYGLNARIQLL